MVKDLIVTVVIRKEQGKYTSWCPELDVASQGVSMEDARKNLQEAVELHVETMVENGDVQLLLEKMGFDEKDLKKIEIRKIHQICEKYTLPFLVLVSLSHVYKIPHRRFSI